MFRGYNGRKNMSEKTEQTAFNQHRRTKMREWLEGLPKRRFSSGSVTTLTVEQINSFYSTGIFPLHKGKKGNATPE